MIKWNCQYTGELSREVRVLGPLVHKRNRRSAPVQAGSDELLSIMKANMIHEKSKREQDREDDRLCRGEERRSREEDRMKEKIHREEERVRKDEGKTP